MAFIEGMARSSPARSTVKLNAYEVAGFAFDVVETNEWSSIGKIQGRRLGVNGSDISQRHSAPTAELWGAPTVHLASFQPNTLQAKLRKEEVPAASSLQLCPSSHRKQSVLGKPKSDRKVQ